ncbi:MAG TPA: hypothetical protein VI911_08975 [Patescibacteria group bacterium]|nr:MAG: hypothetical protein UR43_C0005G0037 [candidate division TM6 bacterium GW2011_GWF2_33_332]HLD91130.1 hypothetical protein [Patescibacteria group bacterium]
MRVLLGTTITNYFFKKSDMKENMNHIFYCDFESIEEVENFIHNSYNNRLLILLNPNGEQDDERSERESDLC